MPAGRKRRRGESPKKPNARPRPDANGMHGKRHNERRRRG